MHVAIAHPYRLGDTVAALPLAGWLHRHRPDVEVSFSGRPYTRPLIERCEHIARYLDADGILADPGRLQTLGVETFINPFPHVPLARAAAAARVPVRIGNLRRTKTLRLCNRFVWISRVHGGLHEVESNLRNLRPLGARPVDRGEWPALYGLRPRALVAGAAAMLRTGRINVILHPKSGGEGREWPAPHFESLARRLSPDRFALIVTGSAAEGGHLRAEVPGLFALDHVVDACGALDVGEFIDLLAAADGIVASGTGPLHIAAACGRQALGLFPPRLGIDPERWAPIGERAAWLCRPAPCPQAVCEPGAGAACACMRDIDPAQVHERLESWRRL